MDTSRTTFCRFSPLRTPDMKQNHIKKLDLRDKNVSDTESLASVVTSDIRRLAHSVTKKLKESSNAVMMSSDDDLFISQSKKVSSPKKLAKKRSISENDSSSRSSSSESEADVIKSPPRKNQQTVSPKKRCRYDSGDVDREKKLKSSVKSSSKSQKKQNNNDIIENSDESSSSSEDDSSTGRKSSTSCVLTSESSKGRRESASSMESQSSIEYVREKSDSRSVDSKERGSDSDRSSRSSDSDSDHEKHSKTRKTSPSKNKTPKRKENSSLNEGRKSRYKIPDNFEIDASANYLSKADIQGKQLWLISAPDDFDISTLHRQKVNLTGSSIIADVKSEREKQFEVVGRPFTSKMSNYKSTASQASGSEEFVLGSQLSGQLQVLEWIPCMPTVELVIPHQEKHRVPDNLKPTFVPFGAKSPTREIEDESFAGETKKEKHKKKKKKKDKKKK
ncbi:uncharacterized protein LOC132722031 [Ruditapes philippinarum]|uniref:uncharacterized protein LOC132722031 n=1 Tax=Ruditapes philippinarum TaxID=129788 RepID=UPI00295BD06C|nr:uncharacterized protein LOC132722031 [Ruditapes philippinarum]XP_060562411.1 uncharacterized protein LOC132722031 [Ruditapes philippinarum]